MLFYLDVTKPYFQIWTSTSLNTTIYLAKDHVPSPNSYDFVSTNDVNYTRELLIDECSINIAVSGRWFIAVYSEQRAWFFIQALNRTASQCGKTNITTPTTGASTTTGDSGDCNTEEANQCDDVLAQCISGIEVTQE
jgi:hypothetical protein